MNDQNISQDTLSRFVRNEVHLCLSAMVSTLAKGYGTVTEPRDLAELCEKAGELSYPVEGWREAAVQDGAKLHFNENAGRWCVLDQRGTDLWEAFFDTEEDAARAYCEQHDVDPYQWEVYEHWAISDALARALEAEGERVDRDFEGLCVWGRTATGQAIHMDGVIARAFLRLAAE